MKKFELSCIERFKPTLIIKEKTGILISNQTDGIMCKHPEVEGFIVPLQHCFRTSSPFNCPDESVEGEYPSKEHIQKWIDKFQIPIEILDKEITEAWINVKILPHEREFSPLIDFIGYEAILTYENSD